MKRCSNSYIRETQIINYSKTFSTVRLAKVQKSSNIGLVRFRKTSNYVGGENVNLYNLYGEILVIIIKIKKAYTL